MRDSVGYFLAEIPSLNSKETEETAEIEKYEGPFATRID